MARMKNYYESRSKSYLTRRTPVIIRLDGKAFHTYTKRLNKPFDDGLISDMQSTAVYLCSVIQGAKLAYTQSDEISILLTDYDKPSTDAWFDYNVQKMASVSASYAASYFNWLRLDRKIEEFNALLEDGTTLIDRWDINHIDTIMGEVQLANFDSRVFNIPKEEVANYFLARQQDAIRNSISMLAQSLYSHKELNGKDSTQLQDMCFQRGHNWNDLSTSKKKGSTVVKNEYWNDELVFELDGIKRSESLTKDNLNNFIFGWNIDCAMTPVLAKDVKIRTKWEVVETPDFDYEYFKRFIRCKTM